MKRGRLELAYEVLHEAIVNPKKSPSRIVARAGAPFKYLEILRDADLITFEPRTRRRSMLKYNLRLVVTPRGIEFCHHVKAALELLPERPEFTE